MPVFLSNCLNKLKAAALRGKTVLVRADFNVPIVDKRVSETFRLDKTLPTLEFLIQSGARAIVMSHIGDDGSTSLCPVYDYLKTKILIDFAEDLDQVLAWKKEKSNVPVLLLENLRQDPGEKDNDPAFAKRLAALGDIYVNEAFAASHRKHASIVAVPKLLPSYFGFQFEEEVDNLSVAFTPEHPFIFILGGAKFTTKAPLVRKFLKSADRVVVGGAIANAFLKAAGRRIGKSVAEEATDMIKTLLQNDKIYLPEDVVVTDGKNDKIKVPTKITTGETIMDIGPVSVAKIKELVRAAGLVVWNGPLGWFEKGYGTATLELASALAKSDAHSIVGGGDTLAAIEALNLERQFSWLSTGGGAMMDFLATGTLPGIEAVEASNK